MFSLTTRPVSARRRLKSRTRKRPSSARQRRRRRQQMQLTARQANRANICLNAMSKRNGMTVSWQTTEDFGRDKLLRSLEWVEKIAVLRAEHLGLSDEKTRAACNDLFKMYKLLQMETQAAFFRDHPMKHLNSIRSLGAANSTAVHFGEEESNDSKLLPKFIKKLRAKDSKTNALEDSSNITTTQKPTKLSFGSEHLNGNLSIFSKSRRRISNSPRESPRRRSIASQSSSGSPRASPHQQIGFLEIANTLLASQKKSKTSLGNTDGKSNAKKGSAWHRNQDNQLQSVMKISNNAAELNFAHRGLGNVRALAMVNAFVDMPHLQHLDLTDNRLSGSSLAELITGFGKLEQLKSLNLSQNKMRADTVTALRTLIRNNKVLAELQVSGCNLNDIHASHLCQVLTESPTITRLDVAHNRIQSDGGIAIGKFIAASKSLKHLNVEHNSIRAAGAQDIARAVRCSHALHTLNISWNNFGRDKAVICLATSLVSNETVTNIDIRNNNVDERSTFVLADVFASSRTWTTFNISGNNIGPRGVRAMLRAVGFRREAVHVRMEDCSQEDKKVYKIAQVVLKPPVPVKPRRRSTMLWAGRKKKKKKKKNKLERNEFAHLKIADPSGFYNLDLRVPTSRAVAGELVRLVALDRGFIMTQVSYFDQGRADKLDLVPMQVSDKEGGVTYNTLFDKFNHKEFRVPLTGRLVCNIDSEAKLLEREHALHDTSFESLLRLVARLKRSQKVTVLQLCAPSLLFTGAQAIDIIKMLHNPNDRASLAKTLSTQIVDSENLAKCFMSTLLPKHIGEMKNFLGAYLDFDALLPSNKYRLDLSNKSDRMVATRLTAINKNQLADRSGLVDTSQHGDRNNFRNTTLNGKSFSPPIEDKSPTITQTKSSSKGSSSSSAGQLWPAEGILETDFISLTTPPADAPVLNGTEFAGMCVSLNLESQNDEGALIEHFVNIVPATASATKAAAAAKKYGELPKRKKSNRREELWQSRRARILKSVSRLNRNVELTLTNLRRAMSGTHINTKQALELVMLFPSCMSARVNCAVALFSTIVDRENFYLIFNSLSHPEQISLGKRIGYLNFFNPEAPDGVYTLDLENNDERQLAEMLVRLAFVEPGENWKEATYKGVAGWSMNKAWEREVPTSGRLHLRYTSVGTGCKPAWIERRRLFRCVLLGDRC